MRTCSTNLMTYFFVVCLLVCSVISRTTAFLQHPSSSSSLSSLSTFRSTTELKLHIRNNGELSQEGSKEENKLMMMMNHNVKLAPFKKLGPIVLGSLFSCLLSTNAFFHGTTMNNIEQQKQSQTMVQVVNAATPNLEGTQAPLFSLPGSTGASVSLVDLTKTGKYTVLYFYPGDFTSGCTLEANAFQKNLDTIKGLNAQVVGVSVDPVDKHVEFKKSCGLDFVLLSDEGGKVSEAYGTALDIPFLGKFSNRQTYLISPGGTVEKVFTNLNGKVSKHPEEVIAALQELKK